jgi:hypothetical protein
MAKTKRTRTGKRERGSLALSQPVEPKTLHMVIVVCFLALGGIVVLTVAFAATHH